MTLYKGRIGLEPGELMEAINRSLPVDIRLLPYDVATNRAWAGELAGLGFYSDEELSDVGRVLDEILEIHQAGGFDPLPDDEDVHTLVERILTEKLGDAGARIHTGRSRNDQVACDLRLYLIDSIDMLIEDATGLLSGLRELIEAHVDTLLAGTTHMQPAQPISLGHFLASLAAAIMRDAERLDDCRKRAALCPLGSGAIAGSGFSVDRQKLADTLGFEGVLPNSLDAIADRDSAQEAAAACAILAAHLSRYAEQFILWSNPRFGYLRFSDRWSTGSSMMPQKRNPDAMELVRGKSARIIGQANSLLVLTKGLPLSYAKDLQEDKSALFDSIDSTHLILQVFTEALTSAEFFPSKMEAALDGDMLATDLADGLSAAGVPFRKAHERVALFVTELEGRGADLLSAGDNEFLAAFPELDHDSFDMTYRAALERRAVTGACAPSRVREQADLIGKWLDRTKG